MEPTISAASATVTNSTRLQPGGIDIFKIIGRLLGETDVSSVFTLNKIVGFFDILWSTYALAAYIFSIGLLVLFVYAATQKRQLDQLRLEIIAEREKIYDERFRSAPKNNRLEDMLMHIATDSPNDWKLAIIEADILLDETLKAAGYNGVSLGERLRSISPLQLQSLDDAWQAHKIRNQIAHGGADFVLTRRVAEDTIKQYRRVLAELGVR